MSRGHFRGNVALGLLLGMAACGLPGAAAAQQFTWQQIYKCAIFSDAVGEYAKAEGRDGADFEKEWDRLMTLALQAHKKEYLGLRPDAKPEELRASWEMDTAVVDKSYEDELDRSADAREFLKQGYNGCAALRTTLLSKR